MTKKEIFISFVLLYFVQGAALAYFINFQKPYLSSLGLPSTSIGLLTSILVLPFVLKIIFAFISDRFWQRKKFMLVGLWLTAISFALCSFFLPDGSFKVFSILIVISSFGVALFDANTDGFAIEVTKERENSLVQGLMIGGKALGLVLLSIVFGFIVKNQGYRSVFFILSFTAIIPIFFVMRFPETTKINRTTFSIKDFYFLKRPEFLVFILYTILYSIVSFGIDGLITMSMSKRYAVANTAIGYYGSMRGIGAIFGAITCAILIRFFKVQKISFLAILNVIIGGFAASYFLAPNTFKVFGIFWGFIWSFQETSFVTIAMSMSRNKLAASCFALFMAFSNLGTALGEGLATSWTDKLGFEPVFISLAILGFIVLLFLKLFFVLSKND